MNRIEGTESGFYPFDVSQFFMTSTDHKKSLNFISKFLQRNVISCENFENVFVSIEKIIQILLRSQLDNDLKKGILNSVMKVPKKWHPQLFAEISHHLNEPLTAYSSNEHDAIRCYFGNIIVLLSNDSVSLYILQTDFSHVASTYESVFCKLQTNRQELTKVREIETAELYHFLIQTLIIFVDESCKYKSSVDFSYSLYESICSLMSNNKLNINTLNNCGLLVVTLNCNFFEVSSSMLLLKRFSEKSPIQCLAICHGFLASASLELHISSCSDNFLALICDTIWVVYSEYANDSLVVIGVLKTILLLAKSSNLESHHVPKNCTQRLIGLLLSHLDHCSSSVKNLSKEAVNHLIQQKNELVISELLTFIEKSSRIDRKSCMILIGFSGTIDFSRILASYKTIIEDLRNAARNAISSSYVCQTYLSLMISDYSDVTVHRWFDVWIKPLMVECSYYSLLLEHVLIPAVKKSDVVFEKLINFCRDVNDENYSIVVKFLLETRTCNASSIAGFSNFYQLNLNSHYWKNLLPFEMMMHAVCVPSSVDALTTAKLIVESIEVNANIFSPEETDLLKFFIDSQFAIAKSEFRCQFLNLQNQLFTKISQYYNSNSSISKAKHISDFIDWIIGYSLSNMFPGASYERRYTALRICKIVIDTNLWFPSLMNTYSVKIFFNGLRDGFEENEEIAKYILKRFFSQNPDLLNNTDKVAAYYEAIDMISGMRFSEHNTAAYLLEILCCTTSSMEYFLNVVPEHEMDNFTEDFVNAEICEENSYFIHLQILVSKLKVQMSLRENESITKYPLYGFLHVIRHLLNHAFLKTLPVANIARWKILINDIIQMSISCNEFAAVYVSHSSPEGYLPDEINDEAAHVFNVAQQTLLCNWRIVKGASLLLGDVVTKFSVDDTRNSEMYLNKKTFLNIGEHLKTLIYKITHKGSFKQVYIALFQYCCRCWRLPDPDINAVPKQWLKEIENMIVSRARELCLTRRGAGIPCVILAIFCTEFDDRRKFKSNLFNEFMENMFETLNNENTETESKIHILNIIRDLFVHKNMAEQISNYIEKAVIVAINGFKSSNWNLKNTSNLLLSAILTRIFGVARSRTDISFKNKMTGKIFFQKYPLLFDIFLFHLQQNEREDINVQSAVYPILLILARLYPSYDDEWNDNLQLTTFVPYVYNCSGNSIFKIRQLTVQAIVPFITRDIYVKHCHKIWFDVMQPLSENTKHGLLLQLDCLLHIIPELNEKQNDDFISLSFRIFSDANSILLGNHSFVIKERLLIILSLLLKRHYNIIDFSKFENYPVNESISNSDKFHLNEQNLLAASNNFDIALKYLASLKNNDHLSFVNLLESIVLEKTTKQNSNSVVDFVLEIISAKNLNDENTIMQILISNHSNDDYRRGLLKSKVIYLFVLNQLLDDRPYRTFEILHVLSEFFKHSQDGNPMKILASFCKKYLNNIKFVLPFLSCLDILLEKQSCWEEEYFFIIKSLLSTYDKLCRDDQRKLRRFLFKYSCSSFIKNDIYLVLDMWTLIIGQISCIDEDDYKNFLKQTSHDFSDSSNFENHFLVTQFMKIFYYNLQSAPVFCSVGLISWITKYLGVILKNVEKNDVFFGDLPEYFEDHLLICQYSFKYLNILLQRSPYIMNDQLSTAALSWILKHGGLKEEEFDNINTIRELISSIVRKFENVVYGSYISSGVSFLSRETVEERIIAVKLSLLSNLLNVN